jgi:hypothetical protein
MIQLQSRTRTPQVFQIPGIMNNRPAGLVWQHTPTQRALQMKDGSIRSAEVTVKHPPVLRLRGGELSRPLPDVILKDPNISAAINGGALKVVRSQ